MIIEERFANKIKQVDDCWLWQGYLYHGYGKFKVDDKLIAAHRFAYELYIGKIPKGMEVDHSCHNKDATCTLGDLCKHRSCVNPEHLEAVTGAENKRRSPLWMGNRTECKYGHGELTFYLKQRQCITCRRENDKIRQQLIRQRKRLAHAVAN